jgi:archaellum component FlaF (FlaF/FlaG flagellin family)
MQFIIQKKSLILSIIFFIFFSFVFVFLYKDINNKKEAIQTAQEKWQTEAIRRENIKFLIDSVKSIKIERTSLDTHFVQSSDVVPFLDTIEELAKNVGANAEVISVDVAKDNLLLVVQMSTSGSFETIYKLILLLENSPYDLEFILVDIKNLNSSIKKIPQWTATLQIKLLSFLN